MARKDRRFDGTGQQPVALAVMHLGSTRLTIIRRSTIVLTATLSLAAGSAGALPWGQKGRAPRAAGLKQSVAGFKSYQACVERLSRQMPAELTLWTGKERGPLELVCRSREAASLDDPGVCRQSLKGYRERQQCQRFFAIFKGRPKDCPKRGWPSYHEGFCTALAARNAALCRAAPRVQRTLCKALLLGERHCRGLASGPRARCRRAVAVWGGVLGKVTGGGGTANPRLELRAVALSSGVTLPANAAHYKDDALEHGLLLADQPGTGDWLIIDQRFAPRESRHRGRPPLRMELKVPIPAAGTGQVTLRPPSSPPAPRTSGLAPSPTPASSPTPRGSASVQVLGYTSSRNQRFEATSGSVTIGRLERRQAGAISGTFDLELSDGIDRIKVSGQFETFVRELVPRATVASYLRSRARRGRHSRGYGALAPRRVADLAVRIRKVRDNLFHVDPGVRREVIADTMILTRAASISRLTGGTQSGFRLYRVYRNNLLWLLGLRDRDVVKKINGKNLDTREDLYEAFVRLRRAGRLVLTLERGGKPHQISYLIRRVRPSRAKTRKVPGIRKKTQP
jgi:hypothetical protein